MTEERFTGIEDLFQGVEDLLLEELFIGIARAPAGHMAHAVALDDLGRILNQTAFAWTPEKLRHALRGLSVRGAEIHVGLEVEVPEPEIERTLLQMELHTKRIPPRYVEPLFGLLPLKKRTLTQRAHLVARILWFTEYRPFPLVEGR